MQHLLAGLQRCRSPPKLIHLDDGNPGHNAKFPGRHFVSHINDLDWNPLGEFLSQRPTLSSLGADLAGANGPKTAVIRWAILLAAVVAFFGPSLIINANEIVAEVARNGGEEERSLAFDGFDALCDAGSLAQSLKHAHIDVLGATEAVAVGVMAIRVYPMMARHAPELGRKLVGEVAGRMGLASPTLKLPPIHPEFARAVRIQAMHRKAFFMLGHFLVGFFVLGWCVELLHLARHTWASPV